MGTDCVCYIEYLSHPNDGWSSFGGGIAPIRNYDIYNRMAGARHGTPIIPLRGLPPTFGMEVAKDVWTLVGEVAGTSPYRVTRAQATEWVERGLSFWGPTKGNADELPTCVSYPDYHSHSWLALDEFTAAVGDDPPVDFNAMLAAMRSIEADGYLARVVFWFIG